MEVENQDYLKMQYVCIGRKLALARNWDKTGPN